MALADIQDQNNEEASRGGQRGGRNPGMFHLAGARGNGKGQREGNEHRKAVPDITEETDTRECFTLASS